jgi:hypothetical protein
MARPLYTNNAASALAAGITSTQTTIEVQDGMGNLFPIPLGGDYFYITVTSISIGGAFEIMQCTARSGDTMTVVRGAEGTSPQSFNIGDNVQLRITAAGMNFLAGNIVTNTQVQNFVATQGQTAFNLTSFSYSPGTNNLSVYVNGSKQVAGTNYTETDLDTFTFLTGLNVGDAVEAIVGLTTAGGTLSANDINYNEGQSGAVNRSVQNKLQETVSVKDFGAVGDGVTDDTAAIQAAIDAVDIGGTVYLFGGVFKTTGEILITKAISFVGEDARVGNVVNYTLSKSCILTESATDAAGILVSNCIATLKNFVIVNGPTTPSVRVDGIRCTGSNGSLKIYDLLVEGFLTGIRSTNNYYNTITNTSIAFCDECLRFDGCYNVNLVGMKLRTNDTPVFAATTNGITLLNGSQVNMFGGAIENFYTNAVYMFGADNSILLSGVYFESPSTASTSNVVQVDAKGSVIAIGCHVYMTHSKRFITVLDSGSLGVRVYSRNNRIVYPTTTKTVEVYVPVIGDNTASWDVAGDNWANPIGANVTYSTWQGVGGSGNLQIRYPVGHPDFLKPINSVPYVQNSWNTTPTLPVSSQTATPLPTFVSYSNQSGTSADDPLNLRLTTWSYNPYMTVYQKGQWEKVGTRLPNQVNSTATTVADLVTDFNALLTKLRNNGVMV